MKLVLELGFGFGLSLEKRLHDVDELHCYRP